MHVRTCQLTDTVKLKFLQVVENMERETRIELATTAWKIASSLKTKDKGISGVEIRPLLSNELHGCFRFFRTNSVIGVQRLPCPSLLPDCPEPAAICSLRGGLCLSAYLLNNIILLSPAFKAPESY
jgi:hypothetical protein